MTAGSFQDVPSIVDPARLDRRNVDLLPGETPHVGDIDIAVVDGESPRIAQSVGPHLWQTGHAIGERVAGRNRIRIATVDLNPDDRAQLGHWVLSVLKGVPHAAAVADRQIEISVSAKPQLTALVGRRCFSLFERDDMTSRCPIGNLRIV